jgi:HAMP domain-containing protein
MSISKPDAESESQFSSVPPGDTVSKQSQAAGGASQDSDTAAKSSAAQDSSNSKKEKKAQKADKAEKAKKDKGGKKAKREKPGKEGRFSLKRKSSGSSGSSGAAAGKGLGMRGKMLILFVLVPVLLILGASALYLQQLQSLTELFGKESVTVVRGMAEDIIAEKSRSVAREVRLYLNNNGDMEAEAFNEDRRMRHLAVQKVGNTGYTVLFEMPHGAQDNYITWVHPNSKIIGKPMKPLLKDALKPSHFRGFWKIYTGVEGDRVSDGYYDWKDSDGEIRQKYMVCTPVPGTDYAIAATAYIDMFMRPANLIKARAHRHYVEMRNMIMGVLGGIVVLIVVIVSWYGNRLTKRIKSLTDVTERISVGELDAEVGVASNDEIGVLSNAIARMQESVRLSIERLRKRR